MEILFKNDVIQPLPIKQVWADHHNSRIEEQCMSPFIAEHIDRLSALTGMDLIVTDMEKHEGPFRADIVCSAGENGPAVVIENMVGNTDTDHIGKIITYMAAEKTNCGIVICGNARTEHVNAIEALNDHGYEIYLFEMSFERYNDSVLCDYILKAGPAVTDCFVTTSGATVSSGRAVSKYAEFFDEFISSLKEDIPCARFYPRDNYQNLFGKGCIWGEVIRYSKTNGIVFEFGYDAKHNKNNDPAIKERYDRMVEELNKRYPSCFVLKNGISRPDEITRALYTVDNFQESDIDKYKQICRDMYEVFCNVK